MIEKFSPEDLLKALSYLKSYVSSSDDIHTYEQSPIHKLLHEEILRYTKEEIENSSAALNDGTTLYSLSFQINNAYIFSAFLKIGAFNNRLCDEAKWLLKQAKNPSNDLYQLVFNVQEAKQKRFVYKESDSSNPSKYETLFNCLFDSYTNNVHKLDTPEKIYVIDKYLTEFGKEKEKHLLYFVANNYTNKSTNLKMFDRSVVCDYIINKLINDGLEPSKADCLNYLLPQQSKMWNSKNFCITNDEITTIKKLLDYGFRFNEKNYSFFDDNLFMATIKSKNKLIIKTILPYLTDITPRLGTMEEQDKFINEFIQTVDKDLGLLIEATYLGITLNNEAANQSTDKKKLKL
jgi:hypothetical protein